MADKAIEHLFVPRAARLREFVNRPETRYPAGEFRTVEIAGCVARDSTLKNPSLLIREFVQFAETPPVVTQRTQFEDDSLTARASEHRGTVKVPGWVQY